MGRIQITYSTNSGSTGEVAEALAMELKKSDREVDTCALKDVSSLDAYESVIIGAPMIFGWHSPARRFVRQHHRDLASKKVAFFSCAIRLTTLSNDPLLPLNIVLDPNLVSQPVNPEKPGFKDRFTSTGHYLRTILKPDFEVKPVSVAFFKGKLDIRKLKWWQAAFIMIVIQGTPGDYRDWEFIKHWGQVISSEM